MPSTSPVPPGNRPENCGDKPYDSEGPRHPSESWDTRYWPAECRHPLGHAGPATNASNRKIALWRKHRRQNDSVGQPRRYCPSTHYLDRGPPQAVPHPEALDPCAPDPGQGTRDRIPETRKPPAGTIPGDAHPSSVGSSQQKVPLASPGGENMDPPRAPNPCHQNVVSSLPPWLGVVEKMADQRPHDRGHSKHWQTPSPAPHHERKLTTAAPLKPRPPESVGLTALSRRHRSHAKHNLSDTTRHCLTAGRNLRSVTDILTSWLDFSLKQIRQLWNIWHQLIMISSQRCNPVISTLMACSNFEKPVLESAVKPDRKSDIIDTVFACKRDSMRCSVAPKSSESFCSKVRNPLLILASKSANLASNLASSFVKKFIKTWESFDKPAAPSPPAWSVATPSPIRAVTTNPADDVGTVSADETCWTDEAESFSASPQRATPQDPQTKPKNPARCTPEPLLSPPVQK